MKKVGDERKLWADLFHLLIIMQVGRRARMKKVASEGKLQMPDNLIHLFHLLIIMQLWMT